MHESKIEIKFKNNHKSVYRVLFRIDTPEGIYIVYTPFQNDGEAITCYAGKLIEDRIHRIKSNDEKEMILSVLENFNKGVK